MLPFTCQPGSSPFSISRYFSICAIHHPACLIAISLLAIASFGQDPSGLPSRATTFSPTATLLGVPRDFAADFTGDGKADVLTYYDHSREWWLQSLDASRITFRKVGNTSGFGGLDDGRPIWRADFNGDSKADVLFYTPGDRNWWLGSLTGGELGWSLVGNTGGFGQVWDGRPFWIADFNGDRRADVLFYCPATATGG